MTPAVLSVALFSKLPAPDFSWLAVFPNGFWVAGGGICCDEDPNGGFDANRSGGGVLRGGGIVPATTTGGAEFRGGPVSTGGGVCRVAGLEAVMVLGLMIGGAVILFFAATNDDLTLDAAPETTSPVLVLMSPRVGA